MSRYQFRAWHHGAGDPRVEPYMKYSEPFIGRFWHDVVNEALGVEVMLFTGLKDVDDVKLFQKDFVLLEECGIPYIDEPFVVDYDDFGVPCFIHPKRLFVSISFQDYFLRPLISRNGFKIVGNIFENPELIKGEEQCTQ